MPNMKPGQPPRQEGAGQRCVPVAPDIADDYPQRGLYVRLINGCPVAFLEGSDELLAGQIHCGLTGSVGSTVQVTIVAHAAPAPEASS